MKKILHNNGIRVVKIKTSGPLFYDDYFNKYYLTKIFGNKIITKITNRLKLGYAQYCIGSKK